MKPQDFRAGQSALGLMARNTETMFAPRMAQWEAFGRGLQDANAIVQNRHGFNEQMEQNRINNEFKERQFGFQESQAQENKRQFNETLAENQRQFDKKHTLDKQNSYYDNQYKQSATDYNYWRMREKEKEQGKQLILKTSKISDELAKDFQILEDGKKVIDKTPEIRSNWLGYGISKLANQWSNGIIGISKEKAAYIAEIENYKNSYMNNIYGKNRTEYKDKKVDNLLDKDFSAPEEIMQAVAETALKQAKIIEDKIRGYRAMGMGDEYLVPFESELAKKKAYFQAFAEGQVKPKEKEMKVYDPKAYFIQNK